MEPAPSYFRDPEGNLLDFRIGRDAGGLEAGTRQRNEDALLRGRPLQTQEEFAKLSFYFEPEFLLTWRLSGCGVAERRRSAPERVVG